MRRLLSFNAVTRLHCSPTVVENIQRLIGQEFQCGDPPSLLPTFSLFSRKSAKVAVSMR